MNNNLWNRETEIKFFTEAMKNFLSPNQLFYALSDEYYAYIPKNIPSEGNTLQSRNSFIGSFTEKWCRNLFDPIAKKFGLYAVNGVVCEELALSRQSNADLALCTSDHQQQRAENIKMIFEIKMSIVSNYMYKPDNGGGSVEFVGDYHTHRGNPSLLRSDSMLKAIGKAINIRVASTAGNKIPIVILGNSPITESYTQKVDMLKDSGIIQGFWSLNPEPCESSFLQFSPKQGFRTMKNIGWIENECNELISKELIFFASMLPKHKLGKYIEIANGEPTIERKAEKFIKLISG